MEWPACLSPDDAPRRSCSWAMRCRRCSRQVMHCGQSGFHRLPLLSTAPATFTAMPCRPRGRERGTRVATVGRQGGQVVDKVGGVGLRSDSEADREQPERRQKGRAVQGTLAGRSWPLPFAGARPLYLRCDGEMQCVSGVPGIFPFEWEMKSNQGFASLLVRIQSSRQILLYRAKSRVPRLLTLSPLHYKGKAVSLRVKARAFPVAVSPCAALPFTLRSGSSRSLREARKSLLCPFCPPPAGGAGLLVAPCSLCSHSRSQALRRMAVGGGIEAVFSQL